MKKGILLSILICILFLQSSCVEVPVEVHEEWYLYRSLTSMERQNQHTSIEMKKVSLEECRQQAEKYAGKNYGQIKFPDNIRIPKRDEIYVYYPKGFPYFDHFDEVLELFFVPGKEALDGKQYWRGFDWGDTGHGQVWINGKESIVFVNNGGGLLITNPNQYPIRDPNEQKRIETIMLEEDKDYSHISYQVMDGEMTLQEALDLLNSKLEKLIALEGIDHYYIPAIAYVCKIGEKEHAYSFVIKRVYEGVMFDSAELYPGMIPRKIDHLWAGSQAQAVISNHDNLDEFGGFDLVETRGESECYQEVISMESALERIANQLDDKLMFQFDEAGLYYVYQIENPVNQMTGERKYELFELSDSTRQIRPFWVFSCFRGGAATIFEHDIKSTVILVDAITGEMQYFHGTNVRY